MFSNHAFSALEMLMVLSIIAVLAMISLPPLQQFLLRTNSDLLRSQFIQAIHLAEQEARLRNLPISLCKSDQHMQCSSKNADRLLIFINEEKDGVLRDKNKILFFLQVAVEKMQFKWRTYPFYRNFLLFSPAQNDNGTFWLCFRDKPVWAIALNRLGRIRLISADKNGAMKDIFGKILNCEN